MFCIKTPRNEEIKKLREIQNFMVKYDPKQAEFFTGQFWTGGQSDFSDELNTWFWQWRSSQTMIHQNYLRWIKGSYQPSPDAPKCISLAYTPGQTGKYHTWYTFTEC